MGIYRAEWTYILDIFINNVFLNITPDPVLSLFFWDFGLYMLDLFISQHIFQLQPFKQFKPFKQLQTKSIQYLQCSFR